MFWSSKIDRRKIIESYGEIAMFEYYNKGIRRVEATLGINHQMADHIEGYGKDAEEAISNLYDKLHYSVKGMVKRIEDERD